MIRSNKSDMAASLASMLEKAISEIAKGYKPGTLEIIMKSDPVHWKKIQQAEKNVNSAILSRDSLWVERSLKFLVVLWKKYTEGDEKWLFQAQHGTKPEAEIGNEKTREKRLL